MIRTGDILENPVTGEQMRFLKTAADTNGETVVVELTLEPTGFVAMPHVHPLQSERFEIFEGSVTFKIGRKRVVAEPGDVVVVEPGMPHKFWNESGEVARFVTVVRPALQFEQLIETMFSLAADGKTSKKGTPNPLRLAVIANHHFDDVRLPIVPHSLQRAALAIGSPIGRLLGYGPDYTPYSPEPALNAA